MIEVGHLTGDHLNVFAEKLVEARPYWTGNFEPTDDSARGLVREAREIIEYLTALDVSRLEPDAMQRYGDILAACRGLTMKYVGPVAHRFRTDRKSISTIMGPYGSAKTTTCFQKIINSAIWQPPGADGVRRARWACIRDTYGHLQTNVMQDWFMWFPKTEKNWSEQHLTHKLNFAIPRANGEVMWLYIEMLFRAMGDQSAEELAKGLSVTGVWLNEKDTLHRDVFKFLWPRCGRYRPPGTPIGGWSGLIGDMNAPDSDNWVYDFDVNKNFGLSADEIVKYQGQFGPDFGHSFHIQPGGMEPDAENLENLSPGYYERLQIGMTEQEKRRFIGNKFGAVRNGNPVYSQYLDTRHCIDDEIRPVAEVPVFIGLDGGGTPAALFGQKVNGQIRVLRECVVFETDAKKSLERMGPTEFGELCGAMWNSHFSGFELGGGWGDPSSWYGASDKHEDDLLWIESFVKGFNKVALGVTLKMKPAPVKGNRIGPRLESVRDVLKGTNDNQPQYVISGKGCPVLRQGYNSGYVTVRVEYSTGGGLWKDDPLKNDFSHVHDANQHLVLGLTKFEGWEDAVGRNSQRRVVPAPGVTYSKQVTSLRAGRRS